MAEPVFSSTNAAADFAGSLLQDRSMPFTMAIKSEKKIACQ
jgi:hypothetical protein